MCADEFEVRFFPGMNNTGGPVGVGAVASIDKRLMAESADGFRYYPAAIPPGQLTLADWPTDERARHFHAVAPDGLWRRAYLSWLESPVRVPLAYDRD